MLRPFIFYLLLVTSNVIAHKRKLSSLVNPGCNITDCDVSRNGSTLLIYVRGDGDTDTVHHIWDFSNRPSLMIARTVPNSTLHVTWDKYLKNDVESVTFSESPTYLMGVVFDKVFEFNDTDSVGRVNVADNSDSYIHMMNTKDFHWKLMNNSFYEDTALISVTGTRHDHKLNKTGTVRITVGTSGGEKHNTDLPHLLYSSNSSQMDIALDNMPTRFASARFGINLVMVTSDHNNSSMKLGVRRSLDDEHDPGVFNIVEITSPLVDQQGKDDVNGGYLQWRPVVYTSKSIDATNSVDCVQYDIANVTDIGGLNGTLFHKLLGNGLAERLIATTNVTFGGSDDKFYNKANYATWTFVAGLGHPVEESFSSLVLMILAIGLGLPVIVIIFGVICVMVRRIIKNKDDLFLSQ